MKSIVKFLTNNERKFQMKKVLCVLCFGFILMSCGSSDPQVCEVVCSHRWKDGTEDYFDCVDATCPIERQDQLE